MHLRKCITFLLLLDCLSPLLSRFFQWVTSFFVATRISWCLLYWYWFDITNSNSAFYPISGLKTVISSKTMPSRTSHPVVHPSLLRSSGRNAAFVRSRSFEEIASQVRRIILMTLNVSSSFEEILLMLLWCNPHHRCSLSCWRLSQVMHNTCIIRSRNEDIVMSLEEKRVS